MCPRIQTQIEIAPAAQTVRVEQDEDEPHGRGEREADHPQSGADVVASAAQDPFEDHQAVESHDDERNAPIWHPQRVEQEWEIASQAEFAPKPGALMNTAGKTSRKPRSSKPAARLRSFQVSLPSMALSSGLCDRAGSNIHCREPEPTCLALSLRKRAFERHLSHL